MVLDASFDYVPHVCPASDPHAPSASVEPVHNTLLRLHDITSIDFVSPTRLHDGHGPIYVQDRATKTVLGTLDGRTRRRISAAGVSVTDLLVAAADATLSGPGPLTSDPRQPGRRVRTPVAFYIPATGKVSMHTSTTQPDIVAVFDPPLAMPNGWTFIEHNRDTGTLSTLNGQQALTQQVTLAHLQTEIDAVSYAHAGAGQTRSFRNSPSA